MFGSSRVRFGITPTVWTNDDFIGIGEDIPFEQCVSEMALAGFEGCSVGHKFPTDARVLRAALELRGLSVTEPWASTFFTVQGMERRTLDGFEEQLAFIKDVGGETVVVAEFGHAVHQQPVSLFANKPVFDDDQWRRLTQGLNRLGERAAAAGMKLCYHHHMGTGVQTRAEVDRLMTGTDPALVNLLLDTAHLRWSGDDPLDMARVYAKRIKHVHCKDVRLAIATRARDEGWTFREGIEAGVFTVPGDGDIDFRPILETLSDAGYRGWLMVEAEQDARKAHPLTYAKTARAYLREVTGL